MEKITLQSNRKWIFKTMLPGVIIIFVFILLIMVMLMVDFEATYSLGIPIVLLYILVPLECVYIIILLVTRYKKGMSYIFYTDKIEVYKKGIFQYSMDVADINTMQYYPFRWHYFITIYAGSLPEGGAWKIHITDYQDKKYSLGFISYKDAKKLQKMYPRLEIRYEKNNKKTN